MKARVDVSRPTSVMVGRHDRWSCKTEDEARTLCAELNERLRLGTYLSPADHKAAETGDAVVEALMDIARAFERLALAVAAKRALEVD